MASKTGAKATTTIVQPPPSVPEPPSVVVVPESPPPEVVKATAAASSPLEMPKVDLPKVEMPKVDLPKVEMPKVDLPQVDMPKIEIPSAPDSLQKPFELPDNLNLKIDAQSLPKVNVGDGVPFIVKVNPEYASTTSNIDIVANAKEKFAIMQMNWYKMFVSSEDVVREQLADAKKGVESFENIDNAASTMSMNMMNLMDSLHIKEYGVYYAAGFAVLLAMMQRNKDSGEVTYDEVLQRQIKEAENKAAIAADLASSKSTSKLSKAGKATIDSVKAETVLVQSKLDSLKAEMEFKDKEISKLTSENTQLTSKLTTFESKLQEQNSKIDELLGKIDPLINENQKLTKIIESNNISIPKDKEKEESTKEVSVTDDGLYDDEEDDKIKVDELIKLIDEEKAEATKATTKPAPKKTKKAPAKKKAAPKKKAAAKASKKKSEPEEAMVNDDELFGSIVKDLEAEIEKEKEAATGKTTTKKKKMAAAPKKKAAAPSTGELKPWSELSDSTLKRKTIKDLTAYLSERGVPVLDDDGKALKKAVLIEAVRTL